MNLLSLDKGFFKRKKLFKLIKSEFIHLVGTDCHNLTSRAPVYKKYSDLIIQKVGIDAFNIICNNAKKIINE